MSYSAHCLLGEHKAPDYQANMLEEQQTQAQLLNKAKVHFLVRFTLKVHSEYSVCVYDFTCMMTVTVAVMTATQLNQNFCNL
jgi:hypothetical protein